jgi:hypothetical protein
VTYLLVAQYLNQLRYRVLPYDTVHKNVAILHDNQSSICYVQMYVYYLIETVVLSDA